MSLCYYSLRYVSLSQLCLSAIHRVENFLFLSVSVSLRCRFFADSLSLLCLSLLCHSAMSLSVMSLSLCYLSLCYGSLLCLALLSVSLCCLSLLTTSTEQNALSDCLTVCLSVCLSACLSVCADSLSTLSLSARSLC